MATKKQTNKIGKVMGEYKEGTLHSGKGGPVVKNRKQAIAIALNVERDNAKGKRKAKLEEAYGKVLGRKEAMK